MNNIIIVSHHHRRSLFFEATMDTLRNGGFNHIAIQETGLGEWGKYQGYSSNYIELGHQNYDTAMLIFNERSCSLIPAECDYILFLDNDLFCLGAEGIKNLVKEAKDNHYDFVCPLVDHKTQSRYMFDSPIVKIPQIVCTPHESGVPVPDPHFHSTPFLFSKDLWLSLKPSDVNHHRKLIAKIVELGANIGALNVNFLTSVAFWREDWFHVGSLVTWYYQLEDRKGLPWKVDSLADRVKAGYFALQSKVFRQDIVPFCLHNRLNDYYNAIGGQQVALNAWAEWVAGTPMEAWK